MTARIKEVESNEEYTTYKISKKLYGQIVSAAGDEFVGGETQVFIEDNTAHLVVGGSEDARDNWICDDLASIGLHAGIDYKFS